jgi:excisionase family DNA binding protein
MRASKHPRPVTNAPAEFERLLTMAEVGRVLGKTAQAVRMMIYRGQISAVKVGVRSVRVKRSDLQAFLKHLRLA